MRASLDVLRPGDTGTVRAVTGADALAVRLLDMGFTRGARVEARGTRGEDPMRVYLRGYTLSLRRSEAGRVLLEAEER